MKVNTVFGDRNTAIVEIKLSDLHLVVDEARKHNSGNPTVEAAITRINGELIDIEIVSDISLSEQQAILDEAESLERLTARVIALAEPYIHNIATLHHLAWEDAAYNRGAKTLAGLLRFASMRAESLMFGLR